MKLTDDEKAMLDGKEGPAKQKAMDLLVRYGNALGAERLVDTNNVCGTVVATNPLCGNLRPKQEALMRYSPSSTWIVQRSSKFLWSRPTPASLFSLLIRISGKSREFPEIVTS